MQPHEFAQYVLDHHEDPDAAYIDHDSVRLLAMSFVILNVLHRELKAEVAESNERFVALIGGTSNRVLEHRDHITSKVQRRALRAITILAAVAMFAILAVVLR